MAKFLKNMGEWKKITDEPAEPLTGPSTPTRRTRRGASEPASSLIKISRESDGTFLSKGDCILVSGKPRSIDVDNDSYYAVIVDISQNVQKYLEMHVAPLVQISQDDLADIQVGNFKEIDGVKEGDSEKDETSEYREKLEDPEKIEADSTNTTEQATMDEKEKSAKIEDSSGPVVHKNELFLSAEVNEISVKDIVEKVKVLSETQFAEVAAAVPSASSIFLCCRATDRFFEKISEKFDFAEWLELLGQSYEHAIEFVAEKTAIIVSPVKKKGRRGRTQSILERLKEKSTPTKRSYRLVEDSDDGSSGSDAKLSSDESESESESESELESDSDEEFVKKTKVPGRGRGRPRKIPASEPSASPRKRKTDSAPATPNKKNRESKDADALKQVMNVLSPLKKGFKVKSGSTLANLPSLSRDNSVVTDSNLASEAFRELREKLHTSTRVTMLEERQEEFFDIYANLESAIIENVGCCLFIYGQPGLGKTATVRDIIHTLRNSVIDGLIPDFEFLELNCLTLISPNAAYEKLYEHVSGIKVTSSNASLLLENHFKNEQDDPERKPLVVLVDEMDQLVTRNQTVIYNLLNWPTYEKSRLIVLAVANSMDLTERVLSNKTASRLGLRKIHFRGYTNKELAAIIATRLKLLSEENKRRVVISEDAMRFASIKVSNVSGDARRALTICRRAVEIAEAEYLESSNTLDLPESEQAYTVRIAHIGRAITETVNSPVASALKNLSFAAKLLLVGVLLRMRRSGQGENPLGDIMDEMKNSLQLLSTEGSVHALRAFSEDANYVSVLYGEEATGAVKEKVRLSHITGIVAELTEQGIIGSQNVRSERHRLIKLKVSEDEVNSALRQDPDMAAML